MSLRTAICITTHNRRVELGDTLAKIGALNPPPDELLVVADGCVDGTAEYVRKHHPQARVIEHEKGLGSVQSRNEMAEATGCDIFLSLDDDSHPIETDAVQRIRTLFEGNPRLAVAEFPQRTDERPESLRQTDFGTSRFIGSYANSGAAIRRAAFTGLGGYFAPFFHAYEEPDFALRCVASGWQVRFEPCVTIRHLWTGSQRNEIRTHQRHARNEMWSVFLRCPMPWLLGVAPFRAIRQFAYACKRGARWIFAEPVWWRQCLGGLGPCWKHRSPLPWKRYVAWMRLVRKPHDDAALWNADFCGP